MASLSMYVLNATVVEPDQLSPTVVYMYANVKLHIATVTINVKIQGLKSVRACVCVHGYTPPSIMTSVARVVAT